MYVNVSKSEWNQPLLPWSITCIAETVYIVGVAVEINGKLILTISKVSELIQVPSASSCPTLNSENHFGWNSYVRKVFLDQGFSQHTIDSSRLVPWNVAGFFSKKIEATAEFVARDMTRSRRFRRWFLWVDSTTFWSFKAPGVGWYTFRALTNDFWGNSILHQLQGTDYRFFFTSQWNGAGF